MGAVIEETMLQDVRVTVLATGFGPDDRLVMQSRAAEAAPASRPRAGVNPAQPPRSVDLDLPAFLQQKNRPQ
jgi:hypothetical protein